MVAVDAIAMTFDAELLMNTGAVVIEFDGITANPEVPAGIPLMTVEVAE